MRREQVVIIGAGPGGCSAAIQCKRLGLEPLVFDRSGRAGGLIENAYAVENYPGLEEADVYACIAYGAEMSRERFVEIGGPSSADYPSEETSDGTA